MKHDPQAATHALVELTGRPAGDRYYKVTLGWNRINESSCTCDLHTPRYPCAHYQAVVDLLALRGTLPAGRLPADPVAVGLHDPRPVDLVPELESADV